MNITRVNSSWMCTYVVWCCYALHANPITKSTMKTWFKKLYAHEKLVHKRFCSEAGIMNGTLRTGSSFDL